MTVAICCSGHCGCSVTNYYSVVASDSGGIGYTLLLALAKGTAVIAVLMAVGKWVLPYLFKEIAKQRTDELFVLATLLVALVAGGMTHLFGLSMALGAFLAGMMLGESQYKHQLEADIRPFRDILMGLFSRPWACSYSWIAL